MEILKVSDLSLGYDGKKIAEHISFSLKEGDYLSIVGENGTGKSTLLKTLLGLVPSYGGKIEFSDALKKNMIGYLPQETQIQRDFPASVREIVLSGCINQQGRRFFYSNASKEIARKAMEKMQITGVANRSYRELSGGQQQRVLLARALCSAKKVIALDEPVSGLDPKLTGEMYRIISDLNKKEKMAVLMISHDIEKAIEFSDHILHIGMEGSFFATKEEYLKSAVFQDFFHRKGGNVK